ncbi:FIGNL1-interacting regulator of recombination and mitosis isoform X4 [Rhineura floridana]|uniref:FIGNL1-interacting regulator of recombination and mitosis isoform X4 n=1 Tax=Rhineura floridana TaxID=261503 RepID=UPI002AC8824E|nr:FIGNL1-interacting regulator of recombination and mitosis isoform X4 [Rhineura floridana]
MGCRNGREIVFISRRQIRTAPLFECLHSMYQTSDNWTQHICVLRILTERFLPHINVSELEQAFFSKILPKTVQLFDLLIYEISNQATRLTSWNVELCETLRNHLQSLVHVLEALTGCVRHICTTQDIVPLEHVYSLPSCVLHVVKNTFVHCKNSESLYSECLHLFSDLLQSLFKEAYTLQKQFMELLEMVSVNSCAAEDSIAVIVSAVHILLEICSAISSIDHAFHANTWKFIIRQSLKHKSLIKNSLKHSDIFNGLCEDILFSFQSCLQLAEQMKQSGMQESIDYKLFQRTIKLCRFFANSLVLYTKEFTPFLGDSCSQLHQTYLQIYSKFPPSLYAPEICEAHQDEIARGFLVMLDSLLPQLLSFRPFLEVVLSKTSDLSPELHFPQCRLLLSIMDKLPSQPQDVQALWNTGSQLPEEIPRVPLFAALFLSLQQCSGELSLPVCLPAVMGTEQAKDLVTFYHYVCIHLSIFITSLSVSHFHLLECSLLETILGPYMITAVLAMDAWCFLARYGTADLCAHHAFIIAHLIKACPSGCFQDTLLGVLLRRLVFLMSADHQVRFTQQFPPKETENLLLWQHLSLQALIPHLRQQVAHELFVAGFTQCQEWLNSKRSLEELPQMNTALSALLSLCQTAGETLELGQRTALVGTVDQFLIVLHATQVSSLPCLQQTFCLMFRLLQFFIQMLEPELLIQIFTLQTSLLQPNPPDHVLIATLDFLSSVGILVIPPDFQIQVLSKLSCLFSSLLANSNWLIHQHAIEAFTQFAEGTSNEVILSQCLNSEEIKSKVVGFLSKTHLGEETKEAKVERMKKANALLKCHLLEVTEDRRRGLSLEPSLKKTCYSATDEEQYKSAVDAVEGILENVKVLLQKSPPPNWLTKKLEALQTTLNSLKNSIC